MSRHLNRIHNWHKFPEKCSINPQLSFLSNLMTAGVIRRSIMKPQKPITSSRRKENFYGENANQLIAAPRLHS